MEEIVDRQRAFLPPTIDMIAIYKDSFIWDNEPCPIPLIMPVSPENKARFDSAVKRLLKIREKKRLPGEVFTANGFRCVTSPESHVGPFVQALDVIVPDGTLVVASAPGIVVEIEESFKKHGGPEAAGMLNFVTIKHRSEMGNVIFTQYCHLGKDSVSKLKISLGTEVVAGQPIARTGMTGYTDEEHLHYLAFRRDHSLENPFGFKSLMLKFN